MTSTFKEQLAAEFDLVESVEDLAVLCTELGAEIARLTHFIANDLEG